MKGPIHHALDTREIEAGEGAIAIAIEDWLSNRVHTHTTFEHKDRHPRREIERLVMEKENLIPMCEGFVQGSVVK